MTYPLRLYFGLELNQEWKNNGFRMNDFKKLILPAIAALGFGLLACSTPQSDFGVYQQSDGTIGVHAPKTAKESEAQEAALVECKKQGKRIVTILESRKTVNDRFPITYIYLCR
jgi:hypothetical protein